MFTLLNKYSEVLDLELITLYVASDQDALSELFLRHNSRMKSVALRVTRNLADAEDVVQNSMISVMRSAHKFRGDSAVSTWLFRIVTNAAIDKIRFNKSHRVYELPTEIALIPNKPVDSELSNNLLLALNSLPVNQRDVVILIDVQGWSISDTAQKLHCAPGTVKSRCHRAHARLAKELRLQN